jgi:NAD(P)-dependent dehydrogenase (short-subunit alcohol dehydrogenase family)
MGTRFQSKVAFVTGATSGMGQDAAIAFAREGAKVVVVGRRVAEGSQTVSMIEDAGGAGIFVQTDVRREEEVKAAVAACVETYGGLDYAFNNAGIGGRPFTALHEYDDGTRENVIAVNLTGVFFCMKHEIPEIQKS